MTFGNPTYLWAFLGLLVPIAIHLWSKREAKTIKIGSIQLLTASDSKQSQQIRLNELLLLLLRLLVIGIVVLIISEPRWKTNTNKSEITYIIEPSVLQNNAVSKLIDSLNGEADIRLLKTTLPKWNSDTQIADSKEIPGYWKLIQEINTLRTDSIVVIANSYLQGFKGKRPNFSRDINWIVFDSVGTNKKIVRAVKKDENLKFITAISDAQTTTISNEVVSGKDEQLQYNLAKDSVQITNAGSVQTVVMSAENPIKVLLYYSDSFVAEKTYIEASFKALSIYLNRSIDIEIKNMADEISSDTSDLVIWLSDTNPPKTTKRILVFHEDEYASNLIMSTSNKNVFQLTDRLNIENSTSKHLTEDLLELLDLNLELEKQVSEFDQRKMDVKEIMPNRTISDTKKTQYVSLDISKWFLLVLFLLLILERLLANYKKL